MFKSVIQAGVGGPYQLRVGMSRPLLDFLDSIPDRLLGLCPSLWRAHLGPLLRLCLHGCEGGGWRTSVSLVFSWTGAVVSCLKVFCLLGCPFSAFDQTEQASAVVVFSVCFRCHFSVVASSVQRQGHMWSKGTPGAHTTLFLGSWPIFLFSPPLRTFLFLLCIFHPGFLVVLLWGYRETYYSIFLEEEGDIIF